MTTAAPPSQTPPDVGTGHLAGAVRALLSDPGAQLGEWECRSIYDPVNQDTLR